MYSSEQVTVNVLDWAVATFDRICFLSSMADETLLHIITTNYPDIDIVFLDTGYHFSETVDFLDQIKKSSLNKVLVAHPEQTVRQQDEMYGEDLFKTQPDLCCSLRKTAPMNKILEGYEAWVTGVRCSDSLSRVNTVPVEYDVSRDMVKLNPVCFWKQTQIDEYNTRHGVPLNPLRALNYTSIGCFPCTRPTAPGEDPRAGRWAGTEKSECGLHL